MHGINAVIFFFFAIDLILKSYLNILAPVHFTGGWQPPALHLYRHMINHFDNG